MGEDHMKEIFLQEQETLSEEHFFKIVANMLSRSGYFRVLIWRRGLPDLFDSESAFRHFEENNRKMVTSKLKEGATVD